MFSVLLTILSLSFYGCVWSEEPTLPPDVARAMRGYKWGAYDCESYVYRNLKWLLGEDKNYSISLPPCEDCGLEVGLHQPTRKDYIKEFGVYEFKKYGLIINASIDLGSISLTCRCRLTDNKGKSYTGSLTQEWQNPTYHVIIKDFFADNWQIIVLANATSFSKENVKTTCTGPDDEFNKNCKQADENGELKNVMREVSEILFNMDEKDFTKLPRNTAKFIKRLRKTIACNMPDDYHN